MYINAIEELTKIVGPAGIEADPERVAAACVDGRGRRFGRALALARPRTSREVSEILRAADRLGLKIIAQGGNTSNVEGATPSPKLTEEESKKFVVLQTSRMRNIIEVDVVNNTMTVEAGVVLQTIQEKAQENGRLFPISFGAQGSAQIGGVASTNAGGVHVLRYGMARDNILGIEVVLADGSILNLMKGLRKDNAGYDLKDLFIGAEGTLGIITKLVLKLHPAPRERISAWISLNSLDDVEKLFNALESALGSSLTAFELVSRTPLEQYEEVFGRTRLPREDWNVLFDVSIFSDMSQVYMQALEDVLMRLYGESIAEAVIAKNEDECREFWKIREEIPPAVKKLGGNVKHDVSIPRSRLAAFIRTTTARLKEICPEVQPSIFGHYGDGNLHFNIGAEPLEEAFRRENEIHRCVHDLAIEHAGSIAAEHGIGEMKVAEFARLASTEELSAMKTLKHAFDPKGILNPGRVLLVDD